jgi:hypothetical protein
MAERKTSLETNAASSRGSATNMTVIAVAITIGLIVLVAVAISVVIALFRKRGMFQYPAHTVHMVTGLEVSRH